MTISLSNVQYIKTLHAHAFTISTNTRIRDQDCPSISHSTSFQLCLHHIGYMIRQYLRTDVQRSIKVCTDRQILHLFVVMLRSKLSKLPFLKKLGSVTIIILPFTHYCIIVQHYDLVQTGFVQSDTSSFRTMASAPQNCSSYELVFTQASSKIDHYK